MERDKVEEGKKLVEKIDKETKLIENLEKCIENKEIDLLSTVSIEISLKRRYYRDHIYFIEGGTSSGLNPSDDQAEALRFLKGLIDVHKVNRRRLEQELKSL